MLNLTFVPLTSDIKHDVSDLYARVFAGPPWFEVKKCSVCGETYGKDDDLILFQDGTPCRRCAEPLKLVDYWTGGPALEVFTDAVTRAGFIGGGAVLNEELIAFSWGFAVPTESTPTVLFAEVTGLLESANINPSQTFYAAETGVDPQYQARGVGVQVSHKRLQSASDNGFTGVCFRTINPKMIRVFEQFFGQGNVTPVFNDPDPLKTNRIWYYCKFASAT